MQENLRKIQTEMGVEKLDGWLLYDHHGNNRFARSLLQLEASAVLTRRFLYWIPQEGVPVKLVHRAEPSSLDHLPGEKRTYLSWSEWEEQLKGLLKGKGRIAMEYSPRNSNPHISLLDAGTMELLKETGVEVISSADLLQHFTSVLTPAQLESHFEAERVVTATIHHAWERIADALRAGRSIGEYDVQQFILSEFAAHNCITEEGPICAVNEHSAFPHYSATPALSKRIQKGDFILIDLWCKQDTREGVYCDITRVAVAGHEPTPLQQEVFSIVRTAQRKAMQFIEARLKEAEPLRGCEVDQVVREYIQERGYGDYFTHRTGHSIDVDVHGSGANIDNLESRDMRMILPNTCFSVEPAIYLPEAFGIRLEHDVVIREDRTAEVTGGVEDHILCLL